MEITEKTDLNALLNAKLLGKFMDDVTSTCYLNLADLLVGRKKPILHSFDSCTLFKS